MAFTARAIQFVSVAGGQRRVERAMDVRVARIVMPCTAYMGMACTVMANTDMDYIGMACIGMAHIVMASIGVVCIVIAYIVMAYIVMVYIVTPEPGKPVRRWPKIQKIFMATG